MPALLHARAAALLALALLAGAAPAQEEGREEPRGLARVEVRVTAVAGGAVYLDAGRDAGIEPGDDVRLLPLGRAPVEGRVASVSRTSARAEVRAPLEGIAIGTAGEVSVPAGRLPRAEEPAPVEEPDDSAERSATEPGAGEEEDAAGAAGLPPRPPWTRPPEEWAEDRPLLAGAEVTRPEERPVDVRGRVTTSFETTEADGRSYAHARARLDLEVENPFGRGGLLSLDGGALHRASDADLGADGDETILRLDRLSYAAGGTRERPFRFEVGRFLQRSFPELGVLDGVELAWRTEGGHLLGGSAGFLPASFPDRDSGEDAAVSLFWRGFLAGDDLQLGLALQKTWHEGAPDRDLLVGTLDWRASETVALHGTAWVDWYSGGDDPKDSGAELTELRLDASWRPSKEGGVRASLARVRWPLLLRDDFPSVPEEVVDRGVVTRASLSGWRSLSERWRARVRGDVWEDEDESGAGGEVELGRRGLLGRSSELAVALFRRDFAFGEATGARATAWKAAGLGVLRGVYEAAFVEQASGEDFLQHRVRGSLDRDFGRHWSASFSADLLAAEEEDALTLGIWLQRRFGR